MVRPWVSRRWTLKICAPFRLIVVEMTLQGPVLSATESAGTFPFSTRSQLPVLSGVGRSGLSGGESPGSPASAWGAVPGGVLGCPAPASSMVTTIGSSQSGWSRSSLTSLAPPRFSEGSLLATSSQTRVTTLRFSLV